MTYKTWLNPWIWEYKHKSSTNDTLNLLVLECVVHNPINQYILVAAFEFTGAAHIFKVNFLCGLLCENGWRALHYTILFCCFVVNMSF